MSIFISFLTIIAWLAAVGGGVVFALNLVAAIKYEGSDEQRLDSLRGLGVRRPWMTCSFVALVLGAAFLAARHWGAT